VSSLEASTWLFADVRIAPVPPPTVEPEDELPEINESNVESFSKEVQ